MGASTAPDQAGGPFLGSVTIAAPDKRRDGPPGSTRTEAGEVAEFVAWARLGESNLFKLPERRAAWSTVADQVAEAENWSEVFLILDVIRACASQLSPAQDLLKACKRMRTQARHFRAYQAALRS